MIDMDHLKDKSKLMLIEYMSLRDEADLAYLEEGMSPTLNYAYAKIDDYEKIILLTFNHEIEVCH